MGGGPDWRIGMRRGNGEVRGGGGGIQWDEIGGKDWKKGSLDIEDKIG